MPPAGTFHDQSADRVRSQFNAHYANFVPALQALVAAESVAQEIGLHVLPPLTSAVEAQQEDAEARTHNQSVLGFMRHAALRSIAERDHTDLLGLFAAPGQLKAKIVLAGAVVEAVLLDDIVDDDATIPSQLLGLTLGGLVTEARRRGAKVSDRVANLAAVAKDYRNDAHPGRELREQPLAPEDVEVVVALMNAVLRERRTTSWSP